MAISAMTDFRPRRLRCQHDDAVEDQPPAAQWPTSPSIVDHVLDLLVPLPLHRRWGLIAYLSERYYDGWRPGRTEIADLIALDSGLLTLDDYIDRSHRRRTAPHTVPDITTLVIDRLERHPQPMNHRSPVMPGDRIRGKPAT